MLSILLDFFLPVLLVMVGAVMMWCRIQMNYGSEPIFKPEEMRAAYHPNRTVRFVRCFFPVISKYYSMCNNGMATGGIAVALGIFVKFWRNFVFGYLLSNKTVGLFL